MRAHRRCRAGLALALWLAACGGEIDVSDNTAVPMGADARRERCLDHVPLRESTMYFSSRAGTTAYRSLSADDIALVGAIYPNDTFRQTTGSLRGTVTRFGASDHRAIHVVAMSLVTNLPAAESHTIGGLVMARLRHIPKEGESIVESGFRFTVEEATDRSIVKLRVEPA